MNLRSEKPEGVGSDSETQIPSEEKEENSRRKTDLVAQKPILQVLIY
jgi:hypothetical protein